MNALEAAQRLERIEGYINISDADKAALRAAQEALRGNPCTVCVHQPPVAGYDKPCVGCPAVGVAIKEGME